MIVRGTPLARISAGLLTVLIFTAGLHEIRSNRAGAADFPCGQALDERAQIEVAPGTSGADIGRILYDKKVIASSEVFFRLAVSDPRASSIAPGTHEVSTRLCAKEALDQLLDSARIIGLIKISEGSWRSEVIDQMVVAGFNRSEVLEAISSIQLPDGITSSEGLFFPAQYSFAKGTSSQSAIGTMIARGIGELSRAGLLSAKGKYTPQDLLTIASIIQAEGQDGDFTKVSRVIRNRLEIGMPLQMDSTVHYVMSSRGQIFLSTKSTLLQSPYNTYRNYGLPPGAISNPGRGALEAAISPAPGDWIYFITVAPGDTRFTASNEEFLQWKIEYKKNLRDGLFAGSKQ